MIEADGEVVDPLSNDDQIRAVLDRFAASHQPTEAKTSKRGPAKKKAEPVQEVEIDESLEPGESLPREAFEGMGPESLDGEDDEPDGLPPVYKKPKPDAGQRDDIWAWYEKFKIGQDPEMDIQLVRVYPTIFPGGVIAAGPLDTFPTPIDETYIAGTYGGGKYEIYAMGPGKGGHGRRRFSRFTINIPGVANAAKPSSLIKDASKGEMRVQGPQAPVPPSENVGVVQQALKTLEKAGDDAQKRAKALEDRFYSGASAGIADAAKFADLIKEESDKRVQILRDQSDREARQLEERVRERDQKIEELRGEVRQMQSAVPGSIKEIVELIRPQSQQGNGMGQEMMNSILTKHATEIEAMRGGHAREVEATRAAHMREIEAMRQSHEREREGDRREAAAREQRVVDQLGQAREERRRDQEMHKQLQEQRDTASRDREQGRVDVLETMWQARVRSGEEATNFRVNALNAELERLRGELAELRSKAREDGDVYSQIERAKQLLDVARDGAGGGLGLDTETAPAPSPAAPKGIIEQMVEYGPMISKMAQDVLGSDAVSGKKKRRAQQPAPMGSIVNTPQGRMVVTPGGMVPEHLYAQAVMNQQSPQMRMFQAPQQRPQQVQMQTRQAQQQPRPPQPPQHWQQPLPQSTPEPQAQQAQQAQRRTSRTQTPAPQENMVVAPNIFEAQEQMAGTREPLTGTVASFVAKALDDGLSAAMEVNEFIDMIREKVPETYLQELVRYPATEVLAGVQEHAPKSLALSPGGIEFTESVMRRLRAMYGLA